MDMNTSWCDRCDFGIDLKAERECVLMECNGAKVQY